MVSRRRFHGFRACVVVFVASAMLVGLVPAVSSAATPPITATGNVDCTMQGTAKFKPGLTGTVQQTTFSVAAKLTCSDR